MAKPSFSDPILRDLPERYSSTKLTSTTAELAPTSHVTAKLDVVDNAHDGVVSKTEIIQKSSNCFARHGITFQNPEMGMSPVKAPLSKLAIHVDPHPAAASFKAFGKSADENVSLNNKPRLQNPFEMVHDSSIKANLPLQPRNQNTNHKRTRSGGKSTKSKFKIETVAQLAAKLDLVDNKNEKTAPSHKVISRKPACRFLSSLASIETPVSHGATDRLSTPEVSISEANQFSDTAADMNYVNQDAVGVGSRNDPVNSLEILFPLQWEMMTKPYSKGLAIYPKIKTRIEKVTFKPKPSNKKIKASLSEIKQAIRLWPNVATSFVPRPYRFTRWWADEENPIFYTLHPSNSLIYQRDLLYQCSSRPSMKHWNSTSRIWTNLPEVKELRFKEGNEHIHKPSSIFFKKEVFKTKLSVDPEDMLRNRPVFVSDSFPKQQLLKESVQEDGEWYIHQLKFPDKNMTKSALSKQKALNKMFHKLVEIRDRKLAARWVEDEARPDDDRRTKKRLVAVDVSSARETEKLMRRLNMSSFDERCERLREQIRINSVNRMSLA